jgi:transcriptional regulator with XRE-family HTH domain
MATVAPVSGPRSQLNPRRAELAAFLRSRRERVHPEDVGLAPSPRRRTPGLRREEVAQRAGLGITWYTWLEQGRPIHPSGQVVDAVARALLLDSHEHEHLRRLCGLEPPEADDALDQVSQPMQAILDGLEPNPAYVTNARYDILAWNGAFVGLYGDLGTVAPRDRNILWLLFTEPSWRRLLVDWHDVARRVVAQFRATMGAQVGDPAWAVLVARLSDASADFREVWARHEIAGPQARTKRYLHSRVGPLSLDYTLLRPAEAPSNRLLIYTPADARSRIALSELSAASFPATQLRNGKTADTAQLIGHASQ